MDIQELMAALAAEAGLSGIDPDADGVYDISLDGIDISVGAAPGADALLVCAIVGELPSDGRERLYETLLRAMYRGCETAGAAFALDRETDAILLQKRLPLSTLDHGRLADELEAFAGVVAKWRNRV